MDPDLGDPVRRVVTVKQAKDGIKREQVRPGIRPLASHLLGSH